MKIINLPIKEVIPFSGNPRNIDSAVTAVVNSIKEFGFKVPIIIDKNNVIVAGHARLKASQELGMSEIPCIIADDLSEEQIKAFRLADNKTAELSTWDEELLLNELKAIENIDMESFGFEFDFNEMELAEVTDDNFEFELPEEPKSKRGEIYQLGNHRLMCGDSTDEEDMKLLMNGKNADMLLTDPPYNVDYEGKAGQGKMENDCMDDGKFTNFLLDAFSSADDSLKPGGAFYIWHADNSSLAFINTCNYVGWKIRQCLIWEKNMFILGRKDYHYQHEPCLYGWKDGAAHYFIDDRTQSTILKYDKPQSSELHPTMKPVPLFGRLIKNSARQNDIVLDIFGGSGTTLIACEQLGCCCYMMECEPKFVDVIINRWEKMTGEKAIKISK